MSEEKKSLDQIKIGSIMRVKIGAYAGFIGRVNKIDKRGVDLLHCPGYIHPDNVEPVEIDDNKNFSIGDIVRPVGAFRAGQLCKVVTKVIYEIQDIDGCVYESEQICEADDKDQKNLSLLVANRFKIGSQRRNNRLPTTKRPPNWLPQRRSKKQQKRKSKRKRQCKRRRRFWQTMALCLTQKTFARSLALCSVASKKNDVCNFDPIRFIVSPAAQCAAFYEHCRTDHA